MTIKISIDADTLETLMGKKDGDISLEIREFLIQEFARHHLKALASTQMYKLIKSEILAEIQDTMKLALNTAIKESLAGLGFSIREDTTRGGLRWTCHRGLPDNIRSEISATIESQLDSELRLKIQEAIAVHGDHHLEQYRGAIDEYINGKLHTMVNTGIKPIREAIFKALWEQTSSK